MKVKKPKKVRIEFPIVTCSNGKKVNILKDKKHYNHIKEGSFIGAENIIGQGIIEQDKVHKHRKHQKSKWIIRGKI